MAKPKNINSLENILSQEEKQQIIDMYKNNVSIRKIAEITKHGRQGLSRILEQAGVKTTKGNHYKYHTLDENFFEKINDELSAYWLGFLYADGCIMTPSYGQQTVKLSLAQTDEQSIVDFAKDLKSTYPIRYDTSRHLKNEKHQIQVIQDLRSQKLVDDLKKLGCVEQKSLILTFPTYEQVPKELMHHFIRGYFDGDGSISSYQVQSNHALQYHINIVGTKDFITKLYEEIGSIGSVFPDKRKENSWYLGINGNQQIKSFYNYLYKDATRYMQRKYNKFQKLINQ